MPASLLYKKHGAVIGFVDLLTKSRTRAVPVAIVEKNADNDVIPDEGGDAVMPMELPVASIQQAVRGDYIQNWTPRDYSKEAMEGIVSGIIQGISEPNPNTYVKAEKPNIIVIMSEAFFDVTQVPNIAFSEDPLVNFRSLQSLPSTITGNIISPTFGGQTCDTEFEFLTGHLMLNVGAGEVPFLLYEKYIKENDQKSIASLLKGQGYRTVGLHTYTGRFYDRDAIYERLGFDEFISADDMPDADISGLFISDNYFAEAIIEQIENTDEPLFLFGISMENHYEYERWKYKGITDIYAESDLLDKDLLDGATALAQGLKNADKSLKKLIDHVAESEKPTLVFFFGDHLPLVGSTALGFYQALGYIESENFYSMPVEETYKAYTTPYLIWANYELKDNNYEDMSPAFIGSVIVEQAGLRDNVYTQFLRDAYSYFHGAKARLFVDSENNIYDEPTAEMKNALQIQHLLQYDYIEGEGFVNERQIELIP